MISLVLASYLVGSVPFAYLWTRLWNGLDIRRIGSKNVGTTNVMVNVGVIPGILTMVGDVLKGSVAALLGSFSTIEWLQYVLPSVAIAGHNWPVWLKFKGGGGLATFIGGCLVLREVKGAILGLIVWGISALIFKDHDRSALTACILTPVLMWFGGTSWSSLTFYLSSGLMIGARRIQSILEKKKTVHLSSHSRPTEQSVA